MGGLWNAKHAVIGRWQQSAIGHSLTFRVRRYTHL